MTAHSPFGSIPIRCKAKACSPPLSPALQAHKAHSMQVEPVQQRGMTSVKQRIEQDMRLLPNGVARIHARCADGAHNPKRKEPIGSFLASQSFSPRIRGAFPPSTPCPWLLALHQAFSRRLRLHDDCPHAARLSRNRDRPRTGDGARE